MAPKQQTPSRRSSIRGALLAISTPGRISADPLFRAGKDVKVPHRSVAATVALSNTVIRSNIGLTTFFNASAIGLLLGSNNGYSNLTGMKRAES